ncbi:hypothetical protein PUNSTDRAFT_145008 [Punctularia strigosozonata HHB-11173 SS5]|uniref:uncharacterized protein n=1 Tax=Punctularia strigosozonata (strain HHB-11173) TaxID=741275 RepID=UPI000441733F|nr:uncharacterized protein PUNSTDRAFT_145008 [Punctularia strigosozonata HHB-11173 SS5]EIN06390.1 hypothetical protein PUNSTDRAFT_145008 [Punctularia strigosozonata HHB-11173 SS5]
MSKTVMWACGWDWCRQTFRQQEALLNHVLVDHCDQLLPIRSSDLVIERRAQDGAHGLTYSFLDAYGTIQSSSTTSGNVRSGSDSQGLDIRAARLSRSAPFPIALRRLSSSSKRQSQTQSDTPVSETSSFIPPGNQAAYYALAGVTSRRHSSVASTSDLDMPPSTPHTRFSMIEQKSSPMVTPPAETVPPSPNFDDMITKATSRARPRHISAIAEDELDDSGDNFISFPSGVNAIPDPVEALAGQCSPSPRKHLQSQNQSQESRTESETDIERQLTQIKPSPSPIITPPRSPLHRKRGNTEDISGAERHFKRRLDDHSGPRVVRTALEHRQRHKFCADVSEPRRSADDIEPECQASAWHESWHQVDLQPLGPLIEPSQLEERDRPLTPTPPLLTQAPYLYTLSSAPQHTQDVSMSSGQ